ncbi:c-type cytochrome [Thiomonas bhubaneswarensis]|uniref:Cytochrome c553 n=1 Tax=Thiomonas bhubaneswarensis TaxID=339866 RepID=A0A0K6I605_9BURK|nr:c-type cytochrome [Thiomonas bhubaneswarensis]CUA98493.1 Cytochrome c553 [Thiomonas bhubaneswarensis]
MKQAALHTTRHALILAAALAAFTFAQASETAAPSVKPWTPVTLQTALKDLPKGNAAAGQKVHDSMMCASCHGATGNAATMNWPSVAGQRFDYTAKMLLDYRSGLRDEDERAGLMTSIARLMTPQQIADVSAYYASLPKPVAPQAQAALAAPLTAAERKRVEQIVRKGDSSRLITACASCHGLHGEGKGTTPAIAGQTTDYFIRTMRLYHGGERHNDVYKGMRQFSQRLSEADTLLIARYYASLGQPRIAQAD